MLSKNKPHSVKDLLQWAVLFLGKDKRIEGELLLAEVCNFSRAKLLAYPEMIISEDKVSKFIELAQRREKGEPFQYLIGRQSFMGLDFRVTPDVLIPRSDTEVLVETVIEEAANSLKEHKILDLCTGSGAIAVSLAYHLKNSSIVAIDISPQALAVAKENAKLNGVKTRIEFLQGDLFTPLSAREQFTMIVSNPPYISTKEMDELPEDVKREPRIALWGGENGLDFYRKIIKASPKYLVPGGYLILEIGYQQGNAVRKLCEEEGFINCTILKDWSGNDRVVKAQKFLRNR